MGNWWAGATRTASAASPSTRRPLASSGWPTTSRPPSRRRAAWVSQLGSSTAMLRTPEFGERVGEQVGTLSDAAQDDDARGVGRDTPRAAEVIRQSLAQLELAARGAVAEGGSLNIAGGPHQRLGPGPDRKERHVGYARAEVEADRAGRGPWRQRRRRPPDRGDQRCRLEPIVQEALRGELRIDVAGHPTRHTELRRQRARRREAHAGPQRAGSDGVAQCAFQGTAECLPRLGFELQPAGIIGAH